MRPKKLLQCIECGGNNFSLRYFCILIISVRARSSSLSLEIPGKSPKLPKYLLDQHSPYPRRITSSDCTLSPFFVCNPPFRDLSNRLLLLGRIHIIKQGLRPSIQIQALIPTIGVVMMMMIEHALALYYYNHLLSLIQNKTLTF